MKKIAVIFLVFTGISCHVDDQPGLGLEKNTMSAKLNADSWKGITEIKLDDVADTLTVLGIANQPNSEVVVIKIKFNGTGLYPLTGNQAYYYSTIGGDVTSSSYKLDANNLGELVISKYNQEEKFLEGSFEMSLVKEKDYSGNSVDVLNFTNGAFKGKISD